jgi:hypothetical protein
MIGHNQPMLATRRPRARRAPFGQQKTIDETALSAFNVDMTALLERAMSRVSDLPAKRQNAIARLLFAEIGAEAQWDESFRTSQQELSELAGAALAERRSRKTRKMDLSHDF